MAYRPIGDILVANGILNPDYTPNEATAQRLGWKLVDEDEALPHQLPDLDGRALKNAGLQQGSTVERAASHRPLR